MIAGELRAGRTYQGLDGTERKIVHFYDLNGTKPAQTSDQDRLKYDPGRWPMYVSDFARWAQADVTPTPMDDLDPLDLDPGIRNTVMRLRALGFETSDSGDGVAKFDAEGNELPGFEGATSGFGVPHVVFIIEPAARLVSEADRLLKVLILEGVEVGLVDPKDSVNIQAAYDPVDGIAVVILDGLDDQGWPLLSPDPRPSPKLPGGP